MKEPHYLKPFFILLSFTIISNFLVIAQRPDKTLGMNNKHTYEAQPSTFINLEDLTNSQSPLEVTLHESGSCSVQQPYLSPESFHQVTGSLKKGEEAFRIGDIYFTIKVDSQNSQIFLSQFQRSSPEKDFQAGASQVFPYKSPNSEYQIFSHKRSQSISIFNTQTELILLDFSDLTKIQFLGSYSNQKQTIVDFTLVRNKFLFVLESEKITVSQMPSLETSTSYSSYTALDGTEKDFKSLQSCATCDNILFIAEGNSVFMIDGTHSLQELTAIKELTMNNPILQLQVVGRSLVILTSKEVIEYIFVKDCLDVRENIRLSSSVIGLGSSITIEKFFAELRGSSPGNYFSVTNKLSSAVYIFQTANQNKITNLFPFYVYKPQEQNIGSTDLYESSTDITSQNNLDILIRHGITKLNIVSFKRSPMGLSCSSLLPHTATASVTTTSRFCQNTMFNYPQTSLFDPTQSCVHEFALEINYKTSTRYIVCGLVAVAGFASVFVFMLRLYKSKNKDGSQVKHTKFQDEKEKDLDTSNNRIDISSLTIPSSTTDRNQKKPNFTPNADPTKKKKIYSKKKNLQIKIPEIKE